jgi:radical SAM-linked protein
MTLRILFSFEKRDAAVFLPHLALVELYSMAFIRAGIPVLFTQGFNPTPKLDFASPLSLGISAGGEIANIDLDLHEGENFTPEEFIQKINTNLPAGIMVTEAIKIRIPSGAKKHTIPSLLWGALYQSPNGGEDLVPAIDEKNYRLKMTSSGSSIYTLNRKTVLAKSRQAPAKPDSYFTIYRSLYMSSDT